MLVLSRKVGERILIGDQIAITVVRLASGGVRLGIEAPQDMLVVREELRRPVGAQPAVAERAPPTPDA
jgi:carbon storage regulator